jgi:hypothetical protein
MLQVRTKSFLGAFLIVFAAVLAGGGLYGANYLKQPKFDSETLCPLSGPVAATLIIIDKTGGLTPLEQDRVRAIVTSEREVLPPGAKLSISVLGRQEGEEQTTLRSVVGLCNPGTEANPLFANPKRVLARYYQSFAEPVDGAMRAFTAQGSAPASPIAVAVGSVIEHERSDSIEKAKLILVSDLMEHTPQASAYDGSFTIAILRKLISRDAQGWLRSAQVELVILPRAQYAGRQRAAIAVWRQFLKETRGRDFILRSL